METTEHRIYIYIHVYLYIYISGLVGNVGMNYIRFICNDLDAGI